MEFRIFALASFISYPERAIPEFRKPFIQQTVDIRPYHHAIMRVVVKTPVPAGQMCRIKHCSHFGPRHNASPATAITDT